MDNKLQLMIWSFGKIYGEWRCRVKWKTLFSEHARRLYQRSGICFAGKSPLFPSVRIAVWVMKIVHMLFSFALTCRWLGDRILNGVGLRLCRDAVPRKSSKKLSRTGRMLNFLHSRAGPSGTEETKSDSRRLCAQWTTSSLCPWKGKQSFKIYTRLHGWYNTGIIRGGSRRRQRCTRSITMVRPLRIKDKLG